MIVENSQGGVIVESCRGGVIVENPQEEMPAQNEQEETSLKAIAATSHQQTPPQLSS